MRNNSNENEVLVSEYRKKDWIFRGLGAAIGGGIGGYFAFIYDNYLLAGLGAVIGSIICSLISLLISKRINLNLFHSVQIYLNKLLGSLSLLLSVGSFVGFFSERNWALLLSAVFFALCSFLLLFHRPQTRV